MASSSDDHQDINHDRILRLQAVQLHPHSRRGGRVTASWIWTLFSPSAQVLIRKGGNFDQVGATVDQDVKLLQSFRATTTMIALTCRVHIRNWIATTDAAYYDDSAMYSLRFIKTWHGGDFGDIQLCVIESTVSEVLHSCIPLCIHTETCGLPFQ